MLANLSRRVAASLSAGIDVRKVWQDEVGRATPRFRPAIAGISRSIDGGQTLAQAIDREDSPFPPLFCQLVALGDATGRLSDILLRLSEQYEHQLRMKRAFLASITWPVIQLVAALSIVGLMIWIMGAIASMTGNEPIDVLGVGLVGTTGLLIYMAFIAVMVGLGYGLFKLLTSDRIASGPLQQVLLKIPVVGQCVESILLSRFAWALGLSLEAGMDVRRALPFAFRGTGSGVFIRHLESATAYVNRGQTVEEALASTAQFPLDFLSVVSVGETTGRLAESLLHEADQQQQRAQSLLETVAKIAGFVIWGLIAVLIASIVIRVIMQVYIKPMRDVMDML